MLSNKGNAHKGNAQVVFMGAHLMGVGDYRTPFSLMAGFILVATVIFWQFFGKQEQAISSAPQLGGVAVAG
jgi:hypothetical protein